MVGVWGAVVLGRNEKKWKALKPYARNILQKELHKRMVKINDLQTE